MSRGGPRRVLPADASYTVLMLVQIVTDADLDALDRIFQDFNVIG